MQLPVLAAVLGLAALAGACAHAAGTGRRPTTVYRLWRYADAPLPYEYLASAGPPACADTVTAGWLRLRGRAAWTRADTSRGTCSHGPGLSPVRALNDSGVVALSGDTLSLQRWEPLAGRWLVVHRGIVRGDTLYADGPLLGGNARVYLRVR